MHNWLTKLYCSGESITEGYSRTPSSVLDVSRLLAGTPEYRNQMVSIKPAQKKILIFCRSYLDQLLSDERKLIAIINLHWLLEQGFVVYGYENVYEAGQLHHLDSPQKINSLFENSSKDKQPPPSLITPANASQLLNLPADTIFILNKENIQDFTADGTIQTNVSNLYLAAQVISKAELRILAKLQNIKKLSLQTVKLGNTSWLEIIEHMTELEELDVCHYETVCSKEIQLSLKNIKKFYIQGTPVPDVVLHALSEAKKIKELKILDTYDFSLPLLLNLNFTNLTHLSLDAGTMNQADLQSVLVKGSMLQELDLYKYKDQSGSSLGTLRFNHLKVFYLSRSLISTEVLWSLLENMPELQELILYNSSSFDHAHKFKSVSLPKLKKLTAEPLKNNTDYLETLLHNARALTELNLLYSKQVMNWDKLTFPNLKILKLSNSTINPGALLIFLEKHKELETIYLDGCKYTGDCEKTNLYLRSLKELHVHDSRIQKEFLASLIWSTDKIEQLDLSCCENITTDMIKTSQLSNSNAFCQIQKLILNNQKMSSSDLIELIMESRPLHHMEFRNCEFIHVSSDYRFANCAIRKLTLTKSTISDETLKDLVKIAPMVTIINNDTDIIPTLKNVNTKNCLINTKNALIVDANTIFVENKQFNIKRQFIGNWQSQLSPSLLRKACYTQIELNQESPSIEQAFILTNSRSYAHLDHQTRNMHRQAQSVAERLNENPSLEKFLGRLEIQLTHAWQSLDSVDSQEQLIAWYLNHSVAVEIVKNPEDQFYYIRVPQSEPLPNYSVHLELLLEKTFNSFTSMDLPEAIQEWVSFCYGFRQDSLEITADTNNPQGYLQALKEQRVGACRHRSVVFYFIAQDYFPQIPVQIIANDCHMVVEVFYQDAWIRCDLGGYDAKLVVNDRAFPELACGGSRQQDPSEQRTITISNRGRPMRHTEMQALKFVTILKLEQMDIATYSAPVAQLDTLEITNCHLDIMRLQALFKKTSQLKTLIISDCHISIDDFHRLDFSVLKMLGYVKLTGSFIPNEASVKKIMATHPDTKKIKWVVDSPNIIATIRTSIIPPIRTTSNPAPTINPVLQPTILANINKPKSSRKRPATRYRVNTRAVHDLESVVMEKKPSLLLNTTDTLKVKHEVYQITAKIQKPVFYADQPEQLECQKPFIKRTGSKARICDGPGGAMYDFIREHSDGIILIDFNHFSDNKIAHFNGAIDEIPHIDGIPLASQKVIGIIDKTSPDVYQGSDFYSRFKRQIDVQLPSDSETKEIQTNSIVIELAGGADWEMRLAGYWSIAGKSLTFKEGRLKTETHEQIILNNPPKNNSEFDRFIDDLRSRGELRHHGELLQSFAKPLDIKLTHGHHFVDKKVFYQFPQDLMLPKSFFVLNQVTLRGLLGKYQLNEQQGISLSPGLLQQYQGKSFTIYITGSLGLHQWTDLLDNAKQYQVHLKFHIAPNVIVQEELISTPVPTKKLAGHPLTQWHVNEFNLPCKIDIAFDVSELFPSDLLPHLDGKFDQAQLCFEFSNKRSFLSKQLKKNKTVVLKGHWPQELCEAMHPFLIKRLQEKKPAGKLILISDEDKSFPFMPCTMHPKPVLNLNPVVVAPFSRRLEYVTSALRRAPFIFITGATGAGKSHFMKFEWAPKHGCFYGEHSILEWAQATTDGEFITLFIDEANLTNRQWSEFQGLLNTPPAIFYKGQYILLSSKHRIIFAGNPLSYGGERTLPRLFQQPHPQIEFKPIPLPDMVAALQLRATISTPILAIINHIISTYPDEVILSPREVLMMIASTQALLLQNPELDPDTVARHFAFNLSKGHIPAKDADNFARAFKPEQPFLRNTPNFQDFLVLETNQPAYEALCHHLTLRTARIAKNDQVVAGGLSGLILEGAPGIGKSKILIQTLVSQGLKENEDFYHIPVSLNHKEKEKKLLEAFHNGKIVIIDEINSSPMLERLLNALLDGHDLDDIPARNPGFLLLGTQNPISFSGRRKMTLPLQHRLQTIILNDYTELEMLRILHQQGIPIRVARDMTEEFLQQQKTDNNLCFRDLLQWAQHWQEKYGDKANIQIPVDPIPQVGSICKTTAIATVEGYYAKKLGYEPIPLHKRGKAAHSVRQIAKLQESKQGEILEFNRWQNVAREMGYQTIIEPFNDFPHFLACILDHLQQDNLPLIGFSVKENVGQPDPDPFNPEDREHAAVITGYNFQTDEFTLTHWGASYIVDAVSLYNSNQALVQTRKQEQYVKNPQYLKENKFFTPKYLPSQTAGIASIVPEANTGFNGKLLVVKKPEDLDQLLIARSESLYKTTGFFTAKPEPCNSMALMTECSPP